MNRKVNSDNSASGSSEVIGEPVALVSVSVTVTREQADYLAKLKEQQGVSASWLVRQLLQKHMSPRKE